MAWADPVEHTPSKLYTNLPGLPSFLSLPGTYGPRWVEVSAGQTWNAPPRSPPPQMTHALRNLSRGSTM